MSRPRIPLIACVFVTLLVPAWALAGAVGPQQGGEVTLRVGDRLPDAPLGTATGGLVMLSELAGSVKLISVVPQLNAPVCAVMVADVENVIRYVELVPMGSLPNFDAAVDAVERLTNRGGR